VEVRRWKGSADAGRKDPGQRGQWCGGSHAGLTRRGRIQDASPESRVRTGSGAGGAASFRERTQREPYVPDVDDTMVDQRDVGVTGAGSWSCHGGPTIMMVVVCAFDALRLLECSQQL
jgi:hypothetical protein